MTAYRFGSITIHSELPLSLAMTAAASAPGVTLRVHSDKRSSCQDSALKIITRGTRTGVGGIAFAGMRAAVREGKYINICGATEGQVNSEWMVLSKLLPITHMQRGHEVLHASSVLYNGRAVLFLGDSGAGKSTCAAFFSLQGDFSILGDDTTALTTHSNGLHAISNSSYARLDAQAADGLNLKRRAQLYDKSFCDLPNETAICGATYGVLRAYLLQAGENVALSRVSAPEKFLILLRSLWFASLHRAVHVEKHLERIKNLASALDLRVLTIPRRIKSLSRAVDLVRADCAASTSLNNSPA